MEYFFGCLTLCFPRTRGATDEPDERTRLFPPPDTVLTPPRRRPNPLPNLHGEGERSRSASATPSVTTAGIGGRGPLSPTISKMGEEHKDRIDSISRMYGKKMQNINQRSSTSTPALPHFPHRISSSDLLTHHNSSPSLPSPHRPPAPALGRSQSEGAALSELGFARHQIPTTSRKSDTVRPRRYTTSTNLLSSGTVIRAGSANGEEGRGRSPGPAVRGGIEVGKGLGKMSTNALGVEEGDEELVGGSRLSGSEFEGGDERESLSPGSGAMSETAVDPEEDVTNYDLGLRHLLPGKRGSRSRGRGGSSRGAKGKGKRVVSG